MLKSTNTNLQRYLAGLIYRAFVFQMWSNLRPNFAAKYGKFMVIATAYVNVADLVNCDQRRLLEFGAERPHFVFRAQKSLFLCGFGVVLCATFSFWCFVHVLSSNHM